MEKATLEKITCEAALLGVALYRDPSANADNWPRGSKTISVREMSEDGEHYKAILSAEREADSVTIRIACMFKTERALADFDNAYGMAENEKRRETLKKERAALVNTLAEIDKQLEKLGGADV